MCAIAEIQDFEAFEYLKMGLPVYSKIGKPAPCPWKFHRYNSLQKLQNSILKPAAINNFLPNDCDLENNILPNHTIEDYEKAKTKALEKLPENQKEKYLRIEKEMSDIDKDDSSHRSWKHFDSDPYGDSDIDELLSDLKNCLFKIEEITEFMETYNIEHSQIEPRMKKSKGTENIPKGKRYSQKIKKKCQEIAAKKWMAEKITIAEMCRISEIKDAAINKSGKPYKERTVRNWIKELAPDHSPGRRSKNNNRH